MNFNDEIKLRIKIFINFLYKMLDPLMLGEVIRTKTNLELLVANLFKDTLKAFF